jgi:ATP-dependent exoDNAse (exonuclease V) beta subunit
MDFFSPDFDSLIKLQDAFSSIKFFEKNHTYEIDGKKALTSVSGLISKFEKPFDSKKAAKGVAQREGVSVETILEKWEFNKNYSCHKGSEFHLYVENFLERRQVPIDRKALIKLFSPNNEIWHENQLTNYYNEMALMIRNFNSFYDWWKEDHILIKSEFVVGDKKSRICGTIDNLSFNKKTKEFAIFDYKTNKEIKTEGFRGETLLKPFDHIQKCELGKYSLQLSLYKEIFERNTPFNIGYTGIVWVAGQDDYEIYKPYDFQEEARLMLNSFSE